MKVLQINTTFKNGGSTGRIAYDLMQIQKQQGIDAYVAFGHNTNASYEPNSICLQGELRRKINILRTRLFDHHGFYNEAESYKLLKWINEIKPDIIHLHNIHNHYVNVKMLFDYIKKKNIPVIWTLHDCWPFTGHCAYFDYAKCEKWKTGCFDCPSLKDYPPTWFFDFSKRNYADKQKTFCGVKKLFLCTPSEWLGRLTRDSFLKEYPVKIINNGVDISVFHPKDSSIFVKQNLGITGKKMILAVASILDARKGLKYLQQLPSMLNEDEVLVIVGVKKEQQNLFTKNNCITIERTNNVQELAEYYSAADVFINPTLEDNFPTTNIESLACGTPVVTFKTGGSVESVSPETGVIVEKHDLVGLINACRIIFQKGKEWYTERCTECAKLNYNKQIQYMKYIDLYKGMLKNEKA